jgi:hypothetical protein
MRAILEVVEGPLAGRRIEIQPGQTIAFGRTPKSDIPIPGDGYLSGKHFQVENSGEACLVRDLGSSNGTFVNGNRVSDQPLQSLDLIAAGSSKFRLHLEEAVQDFSKTSTIPSPLLFENTIEQSSIPKPPPLPMPPPLPLPGHGHTPLPPPPPANPWQQFGPRELRILDTLFATGEPVYAILDATKDMLVRAFVEACGEPVVALTETLIGNRAGIGCYLVAIPKTSVKLLDFLVKDGWGKNWGVYCSSQAGMDAVANHLRNTINVYTVTGSPFQLRLYEPNLLRWFLPGLLPHEAMSVLGPLSRFAAEANGGRDVMSFTQGPNGLTVDLVKLDS